jgi:hypothetical protein
MRVARHQFKGENRMKQLLRLLAVAGATLGALVLSGTAMAAYTSPRLDILNPSERVGGGGPLTIRVSQDRADDATFRLVIYVPQGYTSSLVPQEGAQIGTASAQIIATSISNDAVVPVTGRIVGDSFTPAKYPTGFGCVFGGPPTGTIDGVWVLELTAAGQTLRVPMYVQTITAGPEAAFASGKLTTCLPSPYPEAGAARATLGAKLINAQLTLPSLFANPATGGAYRWRTLWTPYTPNSASPNPAGTVEAQAVDVIPVQLAFASARYRNGRIFVTGSLLENRTAVRNAQVRILVGRTARGVKQVTSVRTNARGNFSAVIRWRRPGRVFLNARVTQAARPVTGCTERTNPAVTCLRTVFSGFTLAANRTVRVR